MKPEPRHGDPALAGTLSLGQLARRWQIPRKQLRRMLGRQELAFVEIRGSIRVPLEEVERFEKTGQLPGEIQ
jgi:hypothetical protein